jgi:hypothetical protein
MHRIVFRALIENRRNFIELCVIVFEHFILLMNDFGNPDTPRAHRPDSRKKFTPYEDACLARLVGQSPVVFWDEIAKQMPGRNARQCRERWKHYVSVGCVTRPWAKAEDELLIEKERLLGPHWTNLTQFFYNRSDVQLKTRWVKLMERRRAPDVIETGSLPQRDDRFKVVFDETHLFDDSSLDFDFEATGRHSESGAWF